MTILARSTPVAVMALACALAACSKQPAPAATEPSANVTTQDASEATRIVGTLPGSGNTGTPVASGGPSDTGTQAGPAAPEGEIPPMLRGRWGLLNADCTSAAGDAKGLLTIGPKQLKFYESVAELKTVARASGDALSGRFDFTGEGSSWTLQVALSSPDGGKTLLRKDTGPEALPQALTYRKCA